MPDVCSGALEKVVFFFKVTSLFLTLRNTYVYMRTFLIYKRVQIAGPSPVVSTRWSLPGCVG